MMVRSLALSARGNWVSAGRCAVGSGVVGSLHADPPRATLSMGTTNRRTNFIQAPILQVVGSVCQTTCQRLRSLIRPQLPLDLGERSHSLDCLLYTSPSPRDS